MNRSTELMLLLTSLALALSGCGGKDADRDVTPDPEEQVRGERAADCDRVAAHGAKVIEGHFRSLAARLDSADREAWMTDIETRFGAEVLSSRCQQRVADADFTRALGCVAEATTMAQVLKCRLWNGAAS